MIGDQQGAYTRLKYSVVGLEVDADDDANGGSGNVARVCFQGRLAAKVRSS